LFNNKAATGALFFAFFFNWRLTFPGLAFGVNRIALKATLIARLFTISGKSRFVVGMYLSNAR
jgi:hypothetical protein